MGAKELRGGLSLRLHHSLDGTGKSETSWIAGRRVGAWLGARG